MAKRLLSLIIASFLVLSLSGCAGFFEKEYLHVTEYSAGTDGKSELAAVSTLRQLKSEVISAVIRHQSEVKLTISGYEGDLQADLSQLGWQIKDENALAAFCVDYVSYDLSRIVSYYEAQIYITYSRPAQEIAAIVPILSPDDFDAVLSSALANRQNSFVVRWLNSPLDDETLNAAILRLWSENSPPPSGTVKSYTTADMSWYEEIILSFDPVN